MHSSSRCHRRRGIRRRLHLGDDGVILLQPQLQLTAVGGGEVAVRRWWRLSWRRLGSSWTSAHGRRRRGGLSSGPLVPQFSPPLPPFFSLSGSLLSWRCGFLWPGGGAERELGTSRGGAWLYRRALGFAGARGHGWLAILGVRSRTRDVIRAGLSRCGAVRGYNSVRGARRLRECHASASQGSKDGAVSVGLELAARVSCKAGRVVGRGCVACGLRLLLAWRKREEGAARLGGQDSCEA
ncbi:unnamed protein product [Urochloa humidicola]